MQLLFLLPSLLFLTSICSKFFKIRVIMQAGCHYMDLDGLNLHEVRIITIFNNIMLLVLVHQNLPFLT